MDSTNGSVATLEAEALESSEELTGTATDEVVDPTTPTLNEEEQGYVDDDPEADASAADSDLNIELPTNDEGDEDRTFDEKLTDPDTWIGSNPLKAEWAKVRKEGEALFGHRMSTVKYVTYMYLVRSLHLKEAMSAAKRGETFKRSAFIKALSDFLMFTTTIPRNQIEVSAWLQMVGLLQLVRAKEDTASGHLVYPDSAPDSTYFTGNLCYSTMKALAPLVRVEKGDGADVYSWQPNCAQIGIDMVADLRAGRLPASASYVIARRKALVEKAEKAAAESKKKALSPEAAYLAEQAEIEALYEENRKKVRNAALAVGKAGKEAKFTPDEVRTQLVRSGVIPPIGTADIVSHMANEHTGHLAIEACLANTDTRRALLAKLAEVLTHQDVNDLYSGTLARLKSNRMDKGASQVLEAFKSIGSKLAQHKAAG